LPHRIDNALIGCGLQSARERKIERWATPRRNPQATVESDIGT